MNVNTIYTSFMGECNPFGIGAPAIFLRFSGCHLRCYKTTLKTLCDTPEALEVDSGDEFKASEIFDKLMELKAKTGIELICITGGEPLYRLSKSLHEILELLNQEFSIVIETSGTMEWAAYTKYENVHFVFDYKAPSTGIAFDNILTRYPQHVRDTDFVKFVIYNEEDYQSMLKAVKEELIPAGIQARFAAGVFWGGEFTTLELFNKLRADGMLGLITLNMQAHKLVVSANTKVTIPKNL